MHAAEAASRHSNRATWQLLLGDWVPVAHTDTRFGDARLQRKRHTGDREVTSSCGCHSGRHLAAGTRPQAAGCLRPRQVCVQCSRATLLRNQAGGTVSQLQEAGVRNTSGVAMLGSVETSRAQHVACMLRVL